MAARTANVGFTPTWVLSAAKSRCWRSQRLRYAVTADLRATWTGIRCAVGRDGGSARRADPGSRHAPWALEEIGRRNIRQGARWDDNPAVDLGL